MESENNWTVVKPRKHENRSKMTDKISGTKCHSRQIQNQDWDSVTWSRKTQKQKNIETCSRRIFHTGDHLRREHKIIDEAESGDKMLVHKRFDEKFIKSVIDWRVKNELKQSDLAKKMNITSRQVKDFEAGKMIYSGKIKTLLERLIAISQNGSK